ncbi:hypothetical protein WJU16_02875 [Chitinophaga pollutisoli]|uniref:Large polyvalent protein associated domain-containing protein n=1 Tax=Chitinophaga pollutisoli TaxID=3133966 RepID=A0ABZ2YR88_9BACT
METEKNIENIPQVKRQIKAMGFGDALNAGIDHAAQSGLEVYQPIVYQAQMAGEAKYRPKISFGEKRAWVDGFEATLYEQLFLDQTVNGVDVRDLSERMTSGRPEPDAGETLGQPAEGIDKAFNDQIRNDLLAIKEVNQLLFVAIAAKFGTYGLDLDNRTHSVISTFQMETTHTRWFPAEEKITLDEAARMLVKSATPTAVRKEVIDYRPIKDVINEWQEKGYGPAEDLITRFETQEKTAFAQQSKLSEKEFFSYPKEMRRFSNFMNVMLETVDGPNIDLMEKVAVWLYIDFPAESKTVHNNMHLKRIKDPNNFLVNKYRDYTWTENMSKNEFWDDIKALQRGESITIETNSADAPLIVISANPEYKTIHILDADSGLPLDHSQFRTDLAQERISQKSGDRNQAPMRIYDGEQSPRGHFEEKKPDLTPAADTSTKKVAAIPAARNRRQRSQPAKAPKERPPMAKRKAVLSDNTTPAPTWFFHYFNFVSWKT